MYQVLIQNNGFFFYLRGTTWTSEAMRGNVFNNSDEAREALLKAKQWTRPALFKKASLIDAGNDVIFSVTHTEERN